jgi:hypothetical protein
MLLLLLLLLLLPRSTLRLTLVLHPLRMLLLLLAVVRLLTVIATSVRAVARLLYMTWPLLLLVIISSIT